MGLEILPLIHVAAFALYYIIFPICKQKIRKPLVPVRPRDINKLPQHALEGLIKVLKEAICLWMVGTSPCTLNFHQTVHLF